MAKTKRKVAMPSGIRSKLTAAVAMLLVYAVYGARGQEHHDDSRRKRQLGNRPDAAGRSARQHQKRSERHR